MATSNVSINSAVSQVATSSVATSSAIDDDEIVYNCKPDPKPEPEKDCCCKTYHIVLNFN